MGAAVSLLRTWEAERSPVRCINGTFWNLKEPRAEPPVLPPLMQHLSIYTTNREAKLQLPHADSLLLFYIYHYYVFLLKG